MPRFLNGESIGTTTTVPLSLICIVVPVGQPVRQYEQAPPAPQPQPQYNPGQGKPNYQPPDSKPGKGSTKLPASKQ